MNQASRIMAGALVLLLLVSFIGLWTIKYAVERDCRNYYKRDLEPLGFWAHIEIGSNEKGCPAPYGDS